MNDKSKICVSCLKNDGKLLRFEDVTNFHEIYKCVTSIQIDIEGKICEGCLDQLLKSWEFVKQCQRTYPLLQVILREEKTEEFPEIQIPPDPGQDPAEMTQPKFYHVPIKKRFYSARKEPVKAVIDIEDIVPVTQNDSLPKDDSCKDCCLESTNICLQKINTNLDENHNSEPSNFAEPNENFQFAIKDFTNFNGSANENLTNFEISSESLLNQNFQNFEVDQESMIDLDSSSIGNIVKVEEPSDPTSFDPTSSENLLDFSKSGSVIFNTKSEISQEIPEKAEISVKKKSRKPTIAKDSQFSVHCDEPGCKNSFKSEENRKIHKILYHSNLINEDNQCIYCDKKFDKKKLLKRHLFLHLKIYQYTCKYCDKGFKLKHQCKTHETLHERPDHPIAIKPKREKKIPASKTKLELLCQICGAKFTSRTSLGTHMKRCEKKVTP